MGKLWDKILPIPFVEAVRAELMPTKLRKDEARNDQKGLDDVFWRLKKCMMILMGRKGSRNRYEK